ncbi:MAG: PspA/IM30 family protein [Rhodobacteraceae bacterium]|nr:PspA/IM30 family protein [Paracoccaceae bacterium]
MLTTLRTIFIGESRRAEEKMRDHYALDLIAQKIRETEDALKAAKGTLGALIQRQRSETRQIDGLNRRLVTMTERAQAALSDDNETLAAEAAQAVATMENERKVRETTLERLDQRIIRLKSSVETMHRRIIDLKQGEIAARAARHCNEIHRRMSSTIGNTAPANEAQKLIDRVLGQEDSFEQAEIMDGINADLDHTNLDDRMAAEGYGPATKSTAADVLARLKS